MFGPLFAVFSQKVGGDLLDITWAWSAYLIVTGLMYLFVGRALQNSKYQERVMVIGYALNTLFTFSYLMVDSVMTLFFVQIGLGIAESLSTPIWDSLFANDLDGKNNTVAIGGLITYYISFHMLFIIMGTIQALATIIQARLLFVKKTDSLNF